MPRTLTEEQSVDLAQLLIMMEVPRDLRLEVITAIETPTEMRLFLDKLSEKKLPDVAGRSARGTLGYDRRVELTGTEYADEAAEESGASFITFSNDYAAVRNHMKEGAVGKKTDLPVKMSL